MIRKIVDSDIDQLKLIHEKFYKDEFSFEEFFGRFLDFFVVTNDENTIVTAGGIRLIAESVIITNKDINTKDRRAALYKLLQAQMFDCAAYQFTQLHAFIQDDKWQEHLEKVGFKKCKGHAIFINV